MRIEELQFGAMMVTALLTLTLVTQVPWHVGRTLNRVRGLLVGAMVLLFVQFLLQYIFDFRAQSVTLGVAVNLLFFFPCSCLMNVALIYLLRQHRVPRSAWLIGFLCWIATIVLFAMTGRGDGSAWLTDTPELQTAEIIAALAFGATQIWYYNLLHKEYHKLKHTLDNYNDDDADERLRWMYNSVMLLAAAALLVPIAIFFSGAMLSLFSVLFFCAIYYCIIHFYRYSVSTTPELVEEAQKEEKEVEARAMEDAGHDDDEATKVAKAEINEAILLHVEDAVAQWTAKKGYLHKKATLQRVADELGVPRNQLSLWLKATDRMFNTWINGLRIEEAKRLLREHAGWSNDSIAAACGFGSRSYFQTVFKENTGMTPAQFVASSSQ